MKALTLTTLAVLVLLKGVDTLRVQTHDFSMSDSHQMNSIFNHFKITNNHLQHTPNDAAFEFVEWMLS